MSDAPNSLYRKLPQMGDLMESARAAELVARYPRALVGDALRAAIAELRQAVRSGSHSEESLEASVQRVFEAVEETLRARLRPSLRRVINATGVVLQTNLGRAPLSEAALERIAEVASGYCNLEFDLEGGERSRRDVHVEGLILDLLALRTGAAMGSLRQTRGAAVVNNCAAATFLALNTLAEGGEVIVSRGELVEIGGGFRIPDILRKSGAVLREVGTTNKTRISDYAAAITQDTRLILRVHRSNFRIDGFTERPSLQELIELGAKSSVPVFEDQGTGCVVALDELGIRDESSWVASATSGAALIAASGDKLLGGPQCGVLVGERGVMDRVRANPLFRALRVDKLTYAALEATLQAYVCESEAEIPAIAMLRMSADEIRARCEAYVSALRSSGFDVSVVETQSLVGGGTTPGASLKSFAVALRRAEMSEGGLAAVLRGLEPAIVARTSEGRVLLDLRTVPVREDGVVMALLASVGAEGLRGEREERGRATA